MALSCCEKFVWLLRGITSNHNGDFYCLNYFHSHSTKEKLEKHENVCNDHDNCYVEMSNDNKIFKKVIESSIHYLCQLRMFARKNAFLSN